MHKIMFCIIGVAFLCLASGDPLPQQKKDEVLQARLKHQDAAKQVDADGKISTVKSEALAMLEALQRKPPRKEPQKVSLIQKEGNHHDYDYYYEGNHKHASKKREPRQGLDLIELIKWYYKAWANRDEEFMSQFFAQNSVWWIDGALQGPTSNDLLQYIRSSWEESGKDRVRPAAVVNMYVPRRQMASYDWSAIIVQGVHLAPGAIGDQHFVDKFQFNEYGKVTGVFTLTRIANPGQVASSFGPGKYSCADPCQGADINRDLQYHDPERGDPITCGEAADYCSQNHYPDLCSGGDCGKLGEWFRANTDCCQGPSSQFLGEGARLFQASSKEKVRRQAPFSSFADVAQNNASAHAKTASLLQQNGSEVQPEEPYGHVPWHQGRVFGASVIEISKSWYYRAWNSHDQQYLSSLFTPDATLNWATTTITGSDAIVDYVTNIWQGKAWPASDKLYIAVVDQFIPHGVEAFDFDHVMVQGLDLNLMPIDRHWMTHFTFTPIDGNRRLIQSMDVYARIS